MLWAELVLIIFFLGLSLCVLRGFPKLFLPKHGRRHRISGLCYLLCLVLGVVQTCIDDRQSLHETAKSVFPLRWQYAAYDIVLGLLGTLATLTAAYDFKVAHEKVKNPNGIVSGTLSERAVVSFDEMIEHSFYQCLNLVQAIYIHGMSPRLSLTARVSLLFAVTSPWLLRSRFPVHSFSANYTASAGGGDPRTFINILYRTKKYQYLLYKHLLLHGLNISLAFAHQAYPLGEQQEWRIYWLCLNTAYTMEFFLQTLVRRRHLSQPMMLSLNTLLMAASTAAAVQVILQHISVLLPCGLLSCMLNFVNRRQELQNVFVCAMLAWLLSGGFSGGSRVGVETEHIQ